MKKCRKNSQIKNNERSAAISTYNFAALFENCWVKAVINLSRDIFCLFEVIKVYTVKIKIPDSSDKMFYY